MLLFTYVWSFWWRVSLNWQVWWNFRVPRSCLWVCGSGLWIRWCRRGLHLSSRESWNRSSPIVAMVRTPCRCRGSEKFQMKTPYIFANYNKSGFSIGSLPKRRDFLKMVQNCKIYKNLGGTGSGRGDPPVPLSRENPANLAIFRILVWCIECQSAILRHIKLILPKFRWVSV